MAIHNIIMIYYLTCMVLSICSVVPPPHKNIPLEELDSASSRTSDLDQGQLGDSVTSQRADNEFFADLDNNGDGVASLAELREVSDCRSCSHTHTNTLIIFLMRLLVRQGDGRQGAGRLW